MSQGIRVMRPERNQLRWEMVDLDRQLPPEHRARLVWSFVTGMDLSEFYARINARDEQAGRPASDPAVLLALWLYATLEGVGAARALARLCEYHAAYRWLCGGVPVNHDLLSAFRRESGTVLDDLLTRGLTSLIAEGLITLEEVAIDGTKTRARAGRGSLAQRPKLDRIEAEVAKRVAALKAELEQDAGAAERKRQQRALRAAEEQEARVKRAQQRLSALEEERAERAKQHAKDEAAKSPPAVSVSDAEARSMGCRMGRCSRRGTCRWRPPMVSSWRSSRPIGAMTAAWRWTHSGRSSAAAMPSRSGCWPTARRSHRTRSTSCRGAMRDCASIARHRPSARTLPPRPNASACGSVGANRPR